MDRTDDRPAEVRLAELRAPWRLSNCVRCRDWGAWERHEDHPPFVVTDEDEV